MRYALANLGRNLVGGLRLALFLPASRLRFRIDLVQLLLLLIVSALLDIAADFTRSGADGYFTWFGLGNEIFGAGLLLLCASLLALLFRQSSLLVAVPVLILSSFPLLQIVRAIPNVVSDTWTMRFLFGSTFDALMITWAFLVCVRSVVAVLDASRHLWLRGLIGGVVLIAPLWFTSLISSNDPWWKEPIGGAGDPNFPNPASEPVLAAQRHLLDDVLANLADERPNVTDLYFVGFAGDAKEDVFRKDVLAAQHVMDERWGTDGRSVVLINNPRTLLETPEATITNLRETLNEIGAAIDTEQDVVMVYLASHGSRDHVLDVSLPPLELAPVTGPALKAVLDGAGIKWRIIVVSACYSGGFIDALQDDYTLVLTASESDRASFGCGNRSDSTFFGEALFQYGLAQSDSLLAAFEAAKVRVAEREKSGGFAPPSNPQMFMGPAMADKLNELDRGNAARRTGRTV